MKRIYFNTNRNSCTTCEHSQALPIAEKNLYQCLHPLLFRMMKVEDENDPSLMYYVHARDYFGNSPLDGMPSTPHGFDLEFDKVAVDMRERRIDWIYEETNWPYSFKPFWIICCNQHKHKIILPDGVRR